MVPASSAHCVVGNTTSAISAVSDMKMSDTTRKSRAADPFRDMRRTRCRHDDVGRDHPQGAHPAVVANGIEHLVGGQTRLRQVVGIDAPDLGDVGARQRVIQAPVTGQLVGLLAVFAAALPVALPGHGAVAGEPAPRKAQGRDARLMNAMTVSEPERCCSAPRAVRIDRPCSAAGQHSYRIAKILLRARR